ncbi:hypothetical protein [uncultured Sphingomonas sp.]|uniref:hypothetical protein n=1 Tax=uncultured Sphingomonas sp. TaxID=158754 RepID=UPI0035CB055F
MADTPAFYRTRAAEAQADADAATLDNVRQRALRAAAAWGAMAERSEKVAVQRAEREAGVGTVQTIATTTGSLVVG